ncbi:MAG TPA: isocitrate lyase/PEP mutase family protein [Patescibacteria group bacterium]
MNKAKQFKELVQRKKAFLLPVVHDALTAKIAEKVGFEAVAVGGFATSGVTYGLPDVGLLGLTDMISANKHIISGTSLPVFVDCDDGYGNERNITKTVEEYEKVGAASIFIEDQKHPKRCGHMEGKEIISTEEMCNKITAAIGARSSEDFLICARTDARALHGLDEAIERAKAYTNAGADIIFIEAPQSREELEIIPKRLPKVTLLVNMLDGGKTPICSKNELEKWGYKIIAYPVTTLFAEVYAVTNALKHLKEKGDTRGLSDSLVDFEEYKKLVEVDKYL